jgi:17beta-estradiol 17-dehydrogenase / very-long-chain 3-oxoacyl-CoA reductase
MTLMTHWLVPKMLKREKRSAIVNLSSVAGEYPLPFISVYSATKAYNDFFSQSIEMEYSQKIDILSVKPLYVESNMSKMKKSCTVASKN